VPIARRSHVFSVKLHKAGSHTIDASDAANSLSVTSGTIVVKAGPPAKLVFQSQPS
jgi:hypothetical protein